MPIYTSANTLSLPVKYPYIVNLREFIRDYFGTEISLDSLLDIKEYVERAKERISSYLESSRYKPTKRNDLEIISFYIGLLVTNLADPWAFRKYIDTESKRARKYLLSESDEVVEQVAKKLNIKLEYLGTKENKCGKAVTLGIDVRRGRHVIECYQYRMPIPQYIVLTEKLCSDNKWKLVNKYVSRGYVYLVKNEVTRLIEEAVKSYLSNVINRYGFDSLSDNPKINDLVSYVLSIVKKVRGFTSSEELDELSKMYGIIKEEYFPPCIKRIKESLIRGEHLSHHQRFALATFLLNIGADIEYVLELFKYSPDFNEKIARYQIEHLAGLRGSRKKYRVYSCEKMRSLGMCINNCGVRSPIAYYWREVKRSLRK